MDFQEYSARAHATAKYPTSLSAEGLNYCIHGLTGEAGEIANKFKKVLRGDKNLWDARADILAELGDVLWYLSEAAHNLDSSLEDVAVGNIQKLDSRRERGVIKGSGDNR